MTYFKPKQCYVWNPSIFTTISKISSSHRPAKDINKYAEIKTQNHAYSTWTNHFYSSDIKHNQFWLCNLWQNEHSKPSYALKNAIKHVNRYVTNQIYQTLWDNSSFSFWEPHEFKTAEQIIQIHMLSHVYGVWIIPYDIFVHVTSLWKPRL